MFHDGFDPDDFTEEERRTAQRQGIQAAIVGTVGGLLVVVAMILNSCEAQAHPPYEWIAEVDLLCCGEDDCFPAEEVRAKITQDKDGNWLVNGTPVPPDNVYLSHEHGRNRDWVCFEWKDDYEIDYTSPRCLFLKRGM